MNTPVPIAVLVVGENPVDSQLLEVALRDASDGPVKVRRASNLEEAARLQEQRFSDVVLLVWDGRGNPATLVRTLRAARPSLPLVVLGESDDGEVALRWIRSGAQDFLVKRRSSGDAIMRALHFASERHKTLLSLEALTSLDELTGLYNRRGILAAGARLLQFARRRSTGLWVLCADVEGLARINEAHGREAADTALVETATALRSGFRSSDLLGRLAGGEFVVLALDAAPESRATLVDRVARCLERRNADPTAAFPVTLAVAAARFEPRSDTELSALIESARREVRAQRRRLRRGNGVPPASDRKPSN